MDKYYIFSHERVICGPFYSAYEAENTIPAVIIWLAMANLSGITLQISNVQPNNRPMFEI